MAFTWLVFAGLTIFLILRYDRTWIGVCSCTVMTTWSIILRVIEYTNIKLTRIDHDDGIHLEDAIYILDRRQFVFILKGSRLDTKGGRAVVQITKVAFYLFLQGLAVCSSAPIIYDCSEWINDEPTSLHSPQLIIYSNSKVF